MKAPDIYRQRAIRRKAAAKYRQNHPASVALKTKRYEYLRKRLMQWARKNAPKLIQQLEREAMRMFPASLVDEDYPSRPA